MSSYIPNAYGECAVYWNVSSDPEPMVCTFGFANATLSTDTTAIAAELRTGLVGTGKLIDTATMFTTNQLTKIRVTVRVGGDLYQGENSTTAVGTVATTATAHPPANNTAFLIQKKSNILGRRNRGRMFWPITNMDTEKVNQLGAIDSTYLAAEQTKWTTLLSYMFTTISRPMYILHSVSEVAPTPVAFLIFNGKVATQRRRMRP